MTQNGVRPTKLYFQHKILKNTVKDKKPLSQPRVNAKLIFYKKCLIVRKTQFLTQNGVRRKRTLFSTQNNEQHSLGQKRPSQPRLDAERIFYKKWLIFSKTQVLTQHGVRPRKTLVSTQHNKKHSSGQKTSFST